MQILSIQIQDSYMQQFMNFVKESHSNITVSKDKNLEIDPCKPITNSIRNS